LAVSRADSLATIPHQTFRARMTGDTRSFADEVLISSFVVRIDDRCHAVGRHLESFLAQTLVTFTDNAVDATVSTGCVYWVRLRWDGHWHGRGFHIRRPIRALFAGAVFSREASLLPGLLGSKIEHLSGGALTRFPVENTIDEFADEIRGRIVGTASFALPNLAGGKHREIHSDVFEICGANIFRHAWHGMAPMGNDRHQQKYRAKSHHSATGKSQDINLRPPDVER